MQNGVSERCHQQHEAIDGGGCRGEVVLADPARGEGKERQPKETVQVGPKNTAANLPGRLEHVMVVVPIDAEVNKAQHVTQKDRQYRLQCRQFDRVRHFQFQHHNRDNDCKDAVTERFEPGRFHPGGPGGLSSLSQCLAALISISVKA